ncbi:Transketolase, C-terminal section [Cronobacter sakazakii 701]|nr:Transketolase, C-terminal section [Cronobacter sakazakii 701]
MVYREQTVFELGKAMRLRDGEDIALVATGSMVAVALKAAEALEAHGLRCAVVDMHTIKPLDTDTLKSLFDRRLLVTLEEHSVVGGLGGAVAEYLAEQGGAPRLCVWAFRRATARRANTPGCWSSAA